MKRITLAMCAAVAVIQGQPHGSGQFPATGQLPTGVYAISDIERIDLVNGNVSLAVPLAQLPPDRNGQGFQLSLFYNSKLWQPRDEFVSGSPVQYLDPSPNGGWRYGGRFQLEPLTQGWTYSSCTNNNAFANQLRLILPDGSKRVLRLRNQSDGNRSGYYPVSVDGKNDFNVICNPANQWEASPVVWYTNDGSYLRVEVDVDQDTNALNNVYRVYLPNGSIVTGTVGASGPQTITDRNGVTLQINNVAVPAAGGQMLPASVVDAGGRSLQITYATTPTGYDAISYNGSTWEVHWDRSNRTSPNYQFSSSSTSSAYFPPIVTKVKVPAGNKEYLFEYLAKWGEVSKITLPTVNAGSLVDKTEITYSYALDGGSVTPGACGVSNNTVLSKNVRSWHIFDGALQPPVNEPWGYNFVVGQSTMTAPDGGVTTTKFFPLPGACGGDPYDLKAGLTYQTIHPDGRVVDQVWRENPPYDPIAANRFGNLTSEWEITTYTAGGTPQTSDPAYAAKSELDQNGNLLKREEFAATTFQQIARSAGGAATGLQSSPTVEKTIQSTFAGAAPSWTSAASDHALAYNKTGTSTRNVKLSTRITGIRGPGSYTELSYDNAATTANVSLERRWNSKENLTVPLNDGNSVKNIYTYEPSANNLLKEATDGRGKVTQYLYNTTACGRMLYPTTIIDGVGLTGKTRTTELEYDCATGQVTLKKDVENNIFEITTVDSFGRPLTRTEGDNGVGLRRRTAWTHDDIGRKTVVRRDLSALADGQLVEVTHYDSRGRVRLSRSSENGATGFIDDETQGIKVQHQHFYSATWTSNPYRSGTSAAASTSEFATMGWQVVERDQAGRPSATRRFGRNSASDTSDVPFGLTLHTYSRLESSTTENGTPIRLMRYFHDGWGKLNKVVEASGSNEIETNYLYDALENLVDVKKKSPSESALEEQRIFEYDSLSRLVKADNPETGVICYGSTASGACKGEYDGVGNLLQQVDARNVITSFGYDSMGRLASKSYSGCGSTAFCPGPVTFEYDDAGIALSRGKLTAVKNDQAEQYFLGFDKLGRVTSSRQRTNAVNYDFGLYQYNLADGLLRKNLPSGKALLYGRDLANRETSVSLEQAGVPSLVASVNSFTPSGAMAAMSYGNGATETRTFNARNQVKQIRVEGNASELMKLTYTYGDAINGDVYNNGNPLSQTIAPLGVTQSYTYDVHQRLKRVDESGTAPWHQEFGYDQFANRWVHSQSPSLRNDGYRPNSVNFFRNGSGGLNKNRFYSSTGEVDYDPAGNLRRAGAGLTLTFDAENRVAKDTTDAVVYGYDGNGRRVRRSAGGKNRIFVYDAMGELAAEYGGDPGVGRQYVFADALGSTRMVLDGQGAVAERMDYLPFGEELQGTSGGSGNPNGRTLALRYREVVGGQQKNPAERFTSKERDAETGLDYFGARYLSAAQGRFTSPDPIILMGQKLVDPQQWNMYSYVRNNPLRLIDPTGMYVCSGTQSECKDFEKERQKSLKSKDSDVVSGASAYGDAGKDNGVSVRFVDPKSLRKNTAGNATAGLEVDPSDPSKFRAKVDVQIGKGQSGVALRDTIAHEGIHTRDAQAFAATATMSGQYDLSKNLTVWQTEMNAYAVSAAVWAEAGQTSQFGTCGGGPCSFGPGMNAQHVRATSMIFLANPANGYNRFVDVGGQFFNNLGMRQFPAITIPAPKP